MIATALMLRYCHTLGHRHTGLSGCNCATMRIRCSLRHGQHWQGPTL